MTLLRGHGLSIELPPGWEGRIFVPDLPPPAVNFPTLHATDRGITMSRSTFASETIRPGCGGSCVTHPGNCVGSLVISSRQILR